MRIVVCTLGTSGDHNPYMAVALELARMGHDVECVVHPSYAKSAATLRPTTMDGGSAAIAGRTLRPTAMDGGSAAIAGRNLRPTAMDGGSAANAGRNLRPLAVHVAGTEMPENYLLEHPELLHPLFAFYEITRQLLLPDAVLQFRELERLHAARKIDAVVAHHIAFGAIWWAERRGVPLTLGWLAPISILRPDGLGSMVPGIARRTPKPLARAVRLAIPFLIRRELDAPMNATRASLGLPSERNSMLRLLTSAHGHVALWDEALRSPADGDPPGLVTCGFPFLAREGGEPPLPADVAQFLSGAPAPIVCALGTTGGPIPLPIADLLAEGCELAGRPALLIGDRPPASARSSRWVAFAPHARAFERTPLVVHHGGIGTLAAVLHAGKPSLVLPLANDQFDNAVRLRGCGAASILDPRKATPAAIAREIRRLLVDRAAADAAARLGARVRASDGARRAAEAIVELMCGG